MTDAQMSIMTANVELTEKEKEVLRSIGKKAYEEMVRKVGAKKLKAIAREQGGAWKKLRKQGKLYHRPSVYDPCPKGTKATKFRHRFVNGVCKCGQKKLTK